MLSEPRQSDLGVRKPESFHFFFPHQKAVLCWESDSNSLGLTEPCGHAACQGKPGNPAEVGFWRWGATFVSDEEPAGSTAVLVVFSSIFLQFLGTPWKKVLKWFIIWECSSLWRPRHLRCFFKVDFKGPNKLLQTPPLTCLISALVFECYWSSDSYWHHLGNIMVASAEPA